MPIGKNSIKRVTNSGYSNVKTSAPDMENSSVAEEKKVTLPKKSADSVSNKSASSVNSEKKPAAKKATAEKKPSASKKPSAAPKKSMETDPSIGPVKTLGKVTKKPAEAPVREGEGYINLGGTLPYYLL